MAHTPGPWRLHIHAHHCIVGDNGRVIVANCAANTTNIDPDGLEAEQAANARLIMAAPELLEALKNVTDTLAYLKGEDWATIIKARAAIAKAEGSAP